jgi:SAM-dependent methyltransferase
VGEIFERPFPPRALEWTGERLTGDTSGQTEIEHLHRYFFARSLCRGLDVLDIASGEGYGSAMMAQVARSVTGVEIDEAAVRHASEAYARPGLRYLQGDAREIPLPNACMDVVVSFETLEHFFEHDAFMSEIRRVLRPGGLAVISSPERDVYSPAGGTPNPYHVHELTHGEFGDLLRRHFDYVALYGQRPLLGAALIPEFTPTGGERPFVTFERRDRRLFEASLGLPRSIYLVAIVSDTPVELSRGCLFVETSGIEAIFARNSQALDEQKRLTDRLIQEGEYAQRVQAELNRRDEQLAAKVAEAQDWHRQLVRRNDEFAALEATLSQTRAEVSRNTEEQALLAAQFHNEIAEVARRENATRLELSRERSDHSRTQVRLQALQQSIAMLREQLRTSQALVRQRDAELSTLHEESAMWQTLARHKDNEFTAMRTEADIIAQQLARQLDDTTQDKIRAEIGLAAVYRSSSWRVTGPMRGLAARHPRTVRRLRAFFARHPRIPRLAIRSVRGTWRLLTLRSPRIESSATPPSSAAISVERVQALEVSPLSPVVVSAEMVQIPEVSQPPAVMFPTETSQTSEDPPARITFFPRQLSVPATLHPDALPRGQGRRLLFVSHVLPFPPRAGNEYRIHRLLSWLARENWRVTLVLGPLPGEPLSETHMAQMASVYPDLIICQHDGTVWYNLLEGADVVEQLRGLAPRAFSLLLGEANAPPQEARIIQLQRTFCPDLLAELLLRLNEALRPQVLLAEYIFMTRPFALLRPEMVKIVDTIDVFSTKASKVEQHGVSDGLALSREEEAILLRRADILIGIQPEEAADLTRLSPDNQVLSVGVDFQVIEQPSPLPSEPAALLVASGNPMNVKGVQDFLQYAWPLVRQAVPQATLRVVGSIGEAIQASPEGVQIVGQVSQLAPEYAAARVAINPAIAGTGLKIKTVEALSHLRPVVTWPAGVDGIGPEGRPFCHVATHWFGFAQILIALLTNEGKADAIGKTRDALATAVSSEQVYAPLRRALEGN